MRTLIISIAALGTALAAGPATAQSYGYPGGGYGQPGYGQNYGGNRYMVPAPWQVRDMVERAAQNREISWGEARHLRNDVRDLFRLYDRMQRYGGDDRLRRDWQRRTFDVLRQLRDARQDGYGYGAGPIGNGPPPGGPGPRPY